LTPAQRQHAREKYKSFNRLPPEKREAVRKNLRERHATEMPPEAGGATPARQ
jgi:hypothetical protein